MFRALRLKWKRLKWNCGSISWNAARKSLGHVEFVKVWCFLL